MLSIIIFFVIMLSVVAALCSVHYSTRFILIIQYKFSYVILSMPLRTFYAMNHNTIMQSTRSKIDILKREDLILDHIQILSLSSLPVSNSGIQTL
jgi:hypothetical protein